jgi:hypothetical protein
MFSGLEFTKYSGRLLGAHQKIDRVARRHTGELLKDDRDFPPIKEILKFEGKNGPDGIKVKSPAKNEPWHFLDPFAEDNSDFLNIIRNHYEQLVLHIKSKNNERAAFEAAWLAHAVVDGLTPPHHYPYEESFKKLRGGEGRETRTSYRDKIIFKGENKRQTIANTFKVYGPRGLLLGHFMFEWGFMLLVKPLRLPDARPSKKDIKEFNEIGLEAYFIRRAREIASLDMFERYLENGWSTSLSNEIRHKLAPLMVRSVTVIWYSASKEANKK